MFPFIFSEPVRLKKKQSWKNVKAVVPYTYLHLLPTSEIVIMSVTLCCLPSRIEKVTYNMFRVHSYFLLALPLRLQPLNCFWSLNMATTLEAQPEGRITAIKSLKKAFAAYSHKNYEIKVIDDIEPNVRTGDLILFHGTSNCLQKDWKSKWHAYITRAYTTRPNHTHTHTHTPPSHTVSSARTLY